MKFIKRAREFIKRLRKKVPTESAVKAHLIGVGNGTLEFVDNTVKFHTQKGRIRKRQELSREIPMSEIEAISRVGNELSITWKGSINIFVIENPELLGTVLEEIADSTGEQESLSQDKEIVEQRSKEVSKTIDATMEISNSLFDILRSLHGWVDWGRIENLLKKSVGKAQKLTDQKTKWAELDFSKLTIAINAHLLEETSKETLKLLTVLYEYFTGKDSENQTLGQLHPNFHDAKTTIQGYFLLNDIILGSIIGDEEIGEEQKELLMTLEDLAQSTKTKININAIKTVISKLGDGKAKESVIEESRMLFRQELKDLIVE